MDSKATRVITTRIAFPIRYEPAWDIYRDLTPDEAREVDRLLKEALARMFNDICYGLSIPPEPGTIYFSSGTDRVELYNVGETRE